MRKILWILSLVLVISSCWSTESNPNIITNNIAPDIEDVEKVYEDIIKNEESKILEDFESKEKDIEIEIQKDFEEKEQQREEAIRKDYEAHLKQEKISKSLLNK